MPNTLLEACNSERYKRLSTTSQSLALNNVENQFYEYDYYPF